MSYNSVWIHAVWGTKNREKILMPAHQRLICSHIFENARMKKFCIDIVNGYLDRMHCLMALRSDWSVARQMQMIKGESANWINKNGILERKFEWADEYFASSVSPGKLAIVRNYIKNQEEHHRKISFDEEYTGFLKSFGFDQG